MNQLCKILGWSQNQDSRKAFFTFPDLTARFWLADKWSKMVWSSRFKGLYATNGLKFHMQDTYYMETAPALKNRRKKSKPGLAEGTFLIFSIWQPIFERLANGQIWSDLRDFKSHRPQMVKIFLLKTFCISWLDEHSHFLDPPNTLRILGWVHPIPHPIPDQEKML